MNIDEIKQLAKQYDIKAGRVAKHELVRSIQQAEGNLPCFKREGSISCGEQNCLWREDCV